MSALAVASALAAACGVDERPSTVRPSAPAEASATAFTPALEAPLGASEPAPAPASEAPTAAAAAAAAPIAGPVTGAPTPRVAARPPAPPVVRVRIPSLGVDAPILQMGVDAAGAMEIPQSSSTVAWYGFTALPGTAGNAVMAGHVTWGGARAVFNQLQALRPGDAIEVQTGEGGVRYAVQRTYLVRPEEADIAHIIGPREGPQTLTLITCGGEFDSSAREYDHRVIVFATRI